MYCKQVNYFKKIIKNNTRIGSTLKYVSDRSNFLFKTYTFIVKNIFKIILNVANTNILFIDVLTNLANIVVKNIKSLTHIFFLNSIDIKVVKPFIEKRNRVCVFFKYNEIY